MAEKMKNDNRRGSNELHGTFSRAVRLLEFLRDNTDKYNTITQSKLFEAGGEDHVFGARNTIQKYIVALAEALNTDEYGTMKPKEDWRLSYKQFDEDYDSDSEYEIPKGVTGIYFNHVFSDDELTAIINALNTSKVVSKTEAEVIIGKLVNNLAKKNFESPAYKLDFSEFTDSLPGKYLDLLSQNITIIQKAISKGFRISFDYNRIYSDPRGYNKKYKDSRGELKVYGKRVRYVSPYYIVCERGRLFLYGGFENGKTCVLCVDMMTNISFSGKGKSTRPSLDKLNVGMPDEMTESFKVRHLYSSYDKNWITATFEWNCRDEKTGEFICTALYGAFGDTFEMDENGIVTVRTSLFGMKIFALQYADCVKVISPDDLVDEIAKSVRGLRDKYL